MCIALVFTSPKEDLFTIGLLFLVLNFFAATQDIGVDGFAVDILEEKEMGPGNSAQISGFKLGNLCGGGILLALSGYIGWKGNFIAMLLIILCAMLLFSLSNEKKLRAQKTQPNTNNQNQQVLKKLLKALKEQGLSFWAFILFVKFGETFGGIMVKPMLIDQKISLPSIGILDGIIGAVATILGGISGGIICRKKGWHKCLMIFSPLQGLALVAYGIYSTMNVTVYGAGIINAFENFCGGCVGVSIFSLAMSRCSKEIGASQFTASQVIYMLGGYLASPLAGFFAEHFTYLPVMALGGVLAMLVSPLALKMYKKQELISA